jgi:hypothetical protein
MPPKQAKYQGHCAQCWADAKGPHLFWRNTFTTHHRRGYPTTPWHNTTVGGQQLGSKLRFEDDVNDRLCVTCFNALRAGRVPGPAPHVHYEARAGKKRRRSLLLTTPTTPPQTVVPPPLQLLTAVPASAPPGTTSPRPPETSGQLSTMSIVSSEAARAAGVEVVDRMGLLGLAAARGMEQAPEEKATAAAERRPAESEAHKPWSRVTRHRSAL